jgi:MFS family permease
LTAPHETAGTWQEVASGWRTVLAAFLPVALHSLPSYGFGALIGPIAAHFSVEVSRIAAWTLFWSLGAIACSLVVGQVVDRIGARRVIAAFLPVYALVLAGLAAFSTSLPILFCFAFLTGIACTGIGSIPSGRLIADRFQAGLGTAFGLMAAGIGLAALTGPFAFQQLVDRFSWHAAYIAMAGAALLVLPVFWLLTGGTAAPRKPACAAATGSTLSFLSTRTFMLLAAGTFLFGMIVTGMSVNLILFLGSQGLDRPQAAGLAGIFGICTIAGRLITGFALDKVTLHIADFTTLVLLALAGCFLLMASGQFAVVLFGLALFGLAVGAEADCLSFAVVRLFGREAYGRVYGLLGVGVLLAGAGFGPVVFTLCVEQLGGYNSTLLIWAVITVVSALCFLAARKSPYAFEDKFA